METTLKANPPRESKKESNARRTVESRRIENRITKIRSWLKMGKEWSNWYKRKEGKPITKDRRKVLIKDLKTPEKEQRKTSYLQTRKTIGFVRDADDYLVILQQHSKAEAESVKERIGIFLKSHLELTQSEDKTHITHPNDEVKFLGFNLRSRGKRTKGLKVEIPRTAIEKLLKDVEQLRKIHFIDESDLILKVNEKVRGWMNYYRYASAPQRTFSDVLNKVFWHVSHYLAGKHKTSIASILRKYSETVTKNGRKRKTLRKWVKGKAIDLWLFPPKTESLRSAVTVNPEIDVQPQTIHEWAKGRSIEKRVEALEEAGNQCQECGSAENLIAHHPGGLRGYRTAKNLAEAGRAKTRRVLCNKCHLKAHQGSYRPRKLKSKDSLTGKPDALKGARPAWEGAR